MSIVISHGSKIKHLLFSGRIPWRASCGGKTAEDGAHHPAPFVNFAESSGWPLLEAVGGTR